VYGPLKGHQISIGGTVFTADGSRFASVSHDSIHARETKSGAKICAIVPDSPSKGWTRAIAFSSDGTRIISALQLELFTRDSTPGVRLLGPFVKGHNAPVYSIACNEDRIVSVTGDRHFQLRSPALFEMKSDAHVWDAMTGELIFEACLDGKDVMSVAFSQDGNSIITRSISGTIDHWDVLSGAPISSRETF
jgi:WD40 repeat protein